MVKRALILVLLATSVCYGTTYYVDGDGGSNGNGGTSAEDAWETLTYAASIATSPGDVVNVYSHTYDETLTITADGTSGNVITFQAAEGETPIIDGEDTRAYGIRPVGDYIKIDGFTVIDAISASVYLQGANCEILDCILSGCREGVLGIGSGIVVVGANADDNLLIGNTIYDHEYVGISIREGADNCTIEDNTIHHCDAEGIIGERVDGLRFY